MSTETMNGILVEAVTLRDLDDVEVTYPAGTKLTVRKTRDFDFDYQGKVEGSNLWFRLENYEFEIV